MLENKLVEYSKSNAYPFHMPGHKRILPDFPNPYSIDITEITGFDDLHHSTGLLLEAQDKAAKLYQADHCYYLVNGSTCGILAAISAATHKGDKVLVARNSHKSVYHALYLRELVPEYIYPETTDYMIQGQIDPEKVEKLLSENKGMSALVITSPTYDGVVSNVKKIAEIVHSFGKVLIVDAAHGAHFGLHQSMPENPITLGADAVIVSVHKTLPSFTQTALLLIKGDRIDKAEIEKFLDIYETSSPSYVLMAGIERCVEFMYSEGEKYFDALNVYLDVFYDRMKNLKQLKVLDANDFSKKQAFSFDRTKIIINTVNSEISGDLLKSILTEKYNIELEMSSESYALAIATIMDSEEGFKRLGDALLEIDATLEAESKQISDSMSKTAMYAYQIQRRQMEIHETDGCEKQKVSLDKAKNQVSSEYIYFYPPGIPILVPGEIISEENIETIKSAVDSGIEVYGLTEDKMIFILKG